MKKTILVLFGILLFIGNSDAQELGRRPNLGVSLQPLTPQISKELSYQGNAKTFVKEVHKNTTGANLKIQEKDILIDYGGVPVGSGFYNLIKDKYREGDKITATVFRNGKVKKLKGKVVGTIKESSIYADIIYDYVDFEGKLRSILYLPKDKLHKDLPVIYYVQGFSCASIEQINNYKNSSVNQLIEGFIKKGYAVYRVEKLGMGDSMNNKHCVEVDAKTEIDGFREGLKRLKEYKYINSNNIFIWGHSLGAMQAPFIARDIGVRGIIGYGYVAKSWYDYIIDIFTVQLPIIENISYGGMQEKINSLRMPLYEFLYEDESLKTLIDKYPVEDMEFIFKALGYNGQTIMGRNPIFLQSLNKMNLLKEHQEIKIPTLSLYGASDLAAIGGGFSVKLIANAINQVAPGKGFYKIIPETNHHLSKVGSIEDNVKVLNAKQTWQNAQENFNEDIIVITDEWIKKQIMMD
ncbi:hypothetical protein [Winogradskyella luteola]|uniref:Uncharacterized protein n=1 Tax=Winogradskyella luteola TaxID=2828330 RepID=A0A9X1F7K6_9FLAO|nr:hypothetical protein [Winogradskyella luteola]MBV7268816.1 hypothetical protein [Winogradskyella luteola]